MDWGGLISGIVLPTVSSIAVGYGVNVARTVAKKYKYDLSEAQEKQLARVIERAVFSAEEIGRRDQLSGQDKRDMAVEAVRMELPSVPTEKILIGIDAALPKARPTFQLNLSKE